MTVEIRDMKKLKYDADGLIPAIIQDVQNGQVLMLAYMNTESVRISLKEGRTCFWSRSRSQLWRKGETSGHIQQIRSISTDCDRDTLLVQVEQTGVACHNGTRSCFQEGLF
jgi:phosphoribosyl-ATP pyrophosphohydrolase/phosphoribosyl-AMP cyclohydrolase